MLLLCPGQAVLSIIVMPAHQRAKLPKGARLQQPLAPPLCMVSPAGPFAIMPSPAAAPSTSGRPPATIITHFAPPQPAAPVLPTSPLVSGSIAVHGGWTLGGDGEAAAAAAAGSAGSAGAKGEGALTHTARFFNLAMTLYEGLLGQRFPLPSMQQVSERVSERVSEFCAWPISRGHEVPPSSVWQTGLSYLGGRVWEVQRDLMVAS